MTTTPAPESASAPGLAAEPAAITLSGLTKRFGSQVAVDDLSLTVPRGQILALLGPNGAGKSTTTEMILGLTRPDAGSVQVCGTNPAQATQRGLVGAMLQSGALLDDVPVRSMLSLVHGVCAHPLPLDEVIDQADVAALLRKSTSKLSGGEAQRVRLALALLPDPEVILLDEPTVAMDVETRRRFWERMRRIAADGRTLVFATHYLEEADQQAERVIVMDRGRIVADGTGTQIKDRIGGRTITATVSQEGGTAGSASTAGPVSTAGPKNTDLHHELTALPGVTGIEALESARLRLTTTDSDATLASLFAPQGPAARGTLRDLIVTAPSLEDAFIQLTEHETPQTTPMKEPA